MDRLYPGCKVNIEPVYARVLNIAPDLEGCITGRSTIIADRWMCLFGNSMVHVQDSRLIPTSPARKEQTVTIADLIAAVPAVGPALSIPDPE